jgi:periplasmic divalent cation tolerance protein
MASEAFEYVVVMTTCASEEQARSLATALLERKLAACVQASDISSSYRWKGAIETNNEVRLMIKARRADYAAIEALIAELHSYETPEVLAIPVVAGSRAYLEWLDAETLR